jgi:tetratricopeptide (TPR) repeat protein
LRANPDAQLRAKIYVYLGVLYRQLGDYAEGQKNSRLALNTDAREVHDIIQQLSATVVERPSAPGYWLLGVMLEGADDVRKARSAYETALRLDPQFGPARDALAVIAKSKYQP